MLSAVTQLTFTAFGAVSECRYSTLSEGESLTWLYTNVLAGFERTGISMTSDLEASVFRPLSPSTYGS